MDPLFRLPPPLRPVALIRVAGLAPVVAFLRRIGAPVERLLARMSLATTLFDRPEALIPLCQAVRFMEDAAREKGIENLGLLAGQETQIDALGVFGRLIGRSLTVRDAIETAMRAMPAFNSGGRYRLAHHGDRVRLGHAFVGGLDVTCRQADQYFLVLALKVLRLAAGPRWCRQEVRLETSRAVGLAELDDVTVAFEHGESAVTFPQSLLNRPLARVCAMRPLEDEDFEAWRASAPAHDFPGSVSQVISALSSPQYPPIAMTADAIGASVRALQRRLAEAGASYGRLVAQARCTTAVDLLERTDATILDIALDLGYSDHAHFTRAFRRWTGLAPREFRQLSRRRLDGPSTFRAGRGSRVPGLHHRRDVPLLPTPGGRDLDVARQVGLRRVVGEAPRRLDAQMSASRS